jgi:hypothetical protein
MTTEQIYELLLEASKDETSDSRKNKIQCLLGEQAAGFNDEYYNIHGRGAGINLILDKLYVDTLENNPKLLPSLLPVFAIISGNREKGKCLVANADWNFINNMNNKNNQKIIDLKEYDITLVRNFIDWKNKLHSEMRGSKLMYDIPKYYKWLDESELFQYYVNNE